MAPSYSAVPAHARPRPASPAERAEEAHSVQLRLKQEAADRRRRAEATKSAKSPAQ